MCVGFCSVDVLALPLAGSPKSHCQLVIAPLLGIEISVNVIVPPTQFGDEILKSAVGACETVIVPVADAVKQLLPVVFIE